MERLGVGIIGAGGIAGAHAKAYAQLAPEVDLVGVADIDEDRARAFAMRHQASFWTTEAEELLRHDEIQLVSICTPHHLHAPLAIAAMEAGKHVLVEKPMAVSLEEADTMIATAKRTRRLISAIFQLRYEADTRRARLVLERGLIGMPFYAEVSCLWWRRPVYYEVSWRGRWSTEGGGALINQASHHVDMLVHLLGLPRTVQATIDTVAHDIEVEDWCMASLRWDTPPMHASFCASTAAELESDVSRIMILGTQGSIQMFPFRPHSRYEERLTEIAETCREVEDPPFPGHSAQIHDFVRCVRDGRQPPVDGVEGRRSLELITAIYQSAFTGEPVQLPLTPADPCYTTAGKLEMARAYIARRAERT
ncbi:MAG: Gfo/Idh/MocA family oxidoreductase [Fimbriimonadales bacterium]|nr:Gfo/Idh/MocA family oxidoreductase [Fimbriimonadales bacterium]